MSLSSRLGVQVPKPNISARRALGTTSRHELESQPRAGLPLLPRLWAGAPRASWGFLSTSWGQCQVGSGHQLCPPPHSLDPSWSQEANLPGKMGEEGSRREGGEGRGLPLGWGRGAVGLPALSDQRAQYFIAGNRSQDINYLGRAALKAF